MKIHIEHRLLSINKVCYVWTKYIDMQKGVNMFKNIFLTNFLVTKVGDRYRTSITSTNPGCNILHLYELLQELLKSPEEHVNVPKKLYRFILNSEQDH